MKKINLNKKRIFGWEMILIAIVGILIIFIGITFAILMRLFAWNDANQVIRQQVLQIKLQAPIRIEKRGLAKTEIVKIVEEIPEYKDLNDIEKYICDKWGVYRCSIVIAIFKSESGLREDALNTYNSNNSVDYGVAQINSINWGMDGCHLKQIVEYKGNIDCAYKIWDRADGKEDNGEGNFSPWSAFNSGSFKDKL